MAMSYILDSFALAHHGRGIPAEEIDLLLELTLLALTAGWLWLASVFLYFRQGRRCGGKWHAFALWSLLPLALGLGSAAYGVHWQYTHPVLLFSAPVAECEAAGVHPKEGELWYAPGDKLAEWARLHGVPQEEAGRVLGFRGHELNKLVPNDECPCDFPAFDLRAAEAERVYFYMLERRYIPHCD